jgi:hypothetical protein
MTYEEAVDYVAERLVPDDTARLNFHFTQGMNFRNTLGLWDKSSPLYQHMLARFGLCHADDTGALICSAASAKVNGRAYDPAEDVARFKAHWAAYGKDPATMEDVETTVKVEVNHKGEVLLNKVSHGSHS